MKKYLGIDHGDVRIGLALADDTGIALPFTIIDHDETVWATLERIVREEGITDIVVGWPISMSGKENERTEKISAFIRELHTHFALPVYKTDERLSTVAARKDTSRARVDAQAAAHILQTYLDVNAARDSI